MQFLVRSDSEMKSFGSAQPLKAMPIGASRLRMTHYLFIRRGDEATWTPAYLPHSEEYISSHYASIEPETGRHFQLDNLINPNSNRPNLTYEFLGITRVWRWTR